MEGRLVLCAASSDPAGQRGIVLAHKPSRKCLSIKLLSSIGNIGSFAFAV